MKFATYRYQEKEYLGVVVDEKGVVEVAELLNGDPSAPASMMELVNAQVSDPGLLARIEYALNERDGPGHSTPLSEVSLRPPMPNPSKILGVAVNNSQFAHLAHRYFAAPAFFMKPPSCLIGDGEQIELWESYGLTHPEPELAAVIGRTTRRVSVQEAPASVFGYTIINDITSPGLKDQDSLHLKFSLSDPMATPIDWRETRGPDDGDIMVTYHVRSKGADTFGPMGPWLVTADEIPDPNKLGVKLWLAEELMTVDNTASLSFSIAQVISHLSQTVTLEPGDIVHFGTAADPSRYALREINITRMGGPLTVEIERIGRLTNPVALLG
jgi:2-keto-4-pentenoate hydratase/2-oxohepta-3-ene-1,7-dioic acid hydratase in catechol pathway